MRNAVPGYKLRFPVSIERLDILRSILHCTETGFLLHYAIGDAIAATPPAPFWWCKPENGYVFVHALSHIRLENYRMNGAKNAALDKFSAIDWGQAREEVVPQFSEGDVYEFKARIAAIKRHGSKESEIPPEELPQWIKERFSGTALSKTTADRKRLSTARRSNNRSRNISIPIVDIEGILTVTDPNIFMERYMAGVCRHKSFGLGMIRIAKI